MTFDEFYILITLIRERDLSEFREGQHAMIILGQYHPEISDIVSMSSNDPYFDDDRMKAFLIHLLQEYVE